MAAALEDLGTPARRGGREALTDLGRDQRVGIAADDEQRQPTRHRLGRIGPVADRLNRADQVVRLLLDGDPVRLLDHFVRRPGSEEVLRRRLPEALASVLLRDPDPFLAERRALGRVGVRARADEHEPREAFGCEARDRARRVPAHRRADRDEPAGHRLEHSQRPVVEARAEPVERRRRGLVISERLDLGRPHPAVERQRVQEDDVHLDNAATTPSSAAIAGRSVSSPSRSSSAGYGDRSKPSMSRRRINQGSVGDVGQPVLERPFDETALHPREAVREPILCPVLAAPEGVVRVAQVGVEAERWPA